ncbi:MAG: MerR family transcriptional regulator [Betaproteobacteria bacterium]
MKIGDLAKKLGVSNKTIRYYETLGLIPEAQRAENGYRSFSTSAIATAQLVSTLRKLKFSIDDIKSLDIINNTGQLRQILEQVLDKKRSDISLDIAILQGQLDELDSRYLLLLQSPKKEGTDCICAFLNISCRC